MSHAAVYRAAWVLPVAAPPIRDGAVRVGPDGRISAVGPAVDVAGRDVPRVELGDAALLPGLINAHAHPELTLLRGRLEDLPFHVWIRELLGLKRATPDLDYGLAARWACLEAMAAGITTVAATEDSDAGFDALIEAGMRGIVYREVFGPDPGQASDAVLGLRAAVDAMRARESDLVRVGLSPHAPYSVSDALYRAVADYAAAETLPLATHVAESAAETELVAHGGGPFAEALIARGIPSPARASSTIALLDGLGLLELRPLLIHCVQLDDADIAMIADAGAPVAHCPIANARLGHGVAPVAAMIDRGITVALGSDSVASNNRMDLLEEARVAQLLQRAALADPCALPAPRLLRMLTVDGARALGLDGRIGSLMPGMDADLCAFRLDSPHTRPVHDPHAALIHAARASDAILTVVRGRVVYQAGRWATLDAAALGARLDAQRRAEPSPPLP
ncbi:MAG: amidohydrolase family protein [Longimicrobiales bacterium]